MRCGELYFYCRVNVQRSVVICAAVVTALAGAVCRLNAGPPTPPVMVVDIIPEVLSGETNTNSEPSLGVNPANPSQIAAWAFIPEPMGGKATPIFISIDGGQTWSCRSTLPVLQKNSCDITMRFGGLSNTLYVAALHDPNYAGPQDKYKPQLVICANDRLAINPMQPASTRGGEGVDQPHVAAATINKHDRVFIGDNDWNGPSGRTATIDRSLDGAGNSPSFTPIPIEFQNSAKDSSEVRPAISADGKKVYAVFNRRVTDDDGPTRVADVILVRDDDGGNSAAPFTALRDQNGAPGLPVVCARTFAWDTLLGGDRNGGDLAIAVDPRNANTVYLVWGELVQDQETLHVIRSDNGGVKWSANLRTVAKAKNPGLAITANGALGFLYQQVIRPEDGQETWMTKLERTKNDFKDTNTLTLATFPVAEVPSGNQPKLGDYLHLMSVGNDFYGIFSASNVPDPTRFPCGVTFQRRVNLKDKTLLNLDGNKVDPSIDPFFVRVREE